MQEAFKINFFEADLGVISVVTFCNLKSENQYFCGINNIKIYNKLGADFWIVSA
ncbi:MAG TPA: hypothetical protein GX745_01640 [Clostridiales bacterium]|jgi:hypothetical protein|nr:hypothetical protein [Clostridiales bacterium]